MFKNFALNDGQIIRFDLDFRTKELHTDLKIRKIVANQEFIPCKVRLKFVGVFELNVLEDFQTEYYSDITILNQSNNTVYVSFDPYGNSGQPHQQDNWIIKANTLSIVELA